MVSQLRAGGQSRRMMSYLSLTTASARARISRSSGLFRILSTATRSASAATRSRFSLIWWMGMRFLSKMSVTVSSGMSLRNVVVRLAWVSRSTASTRNPRLVKYPAREDTVVVLATPPLRFPNAMMMGFFM